MCQLLLRFQGYQDLGMQDGSQIRRLEQESWILNVNWLWYWYAVFINGQQCVEDILGDADCKTFWQQKVCKQKPENPSQSFNSFQCFHLATSCGLFSLNLQEGGQICMCHAPSWLFAWFWGTRPGQAIYAKWNLTFHTCIPLLLCWHGHLSHSISNVNLISQACCAGLLVPWSLLEICKLFYSSKPMQTHSSTAQLWYDDWNHHVRLLILRWALQQVFLATLPLLQSSSTTAYVQFLASRHRFVMVCCGERSHGMS